MKSNEELNKKYWSLFDTPIEAEAPVSESIKVLQPKTREFKPIMTEEEFNKVFSNILKTNNE
jgi:hypothetical protein